MSIAIHDAPARRDEVERQVSLIDLALPTFRIRGDQRRTKSQAEAVTILKALLHWADSRNVILEDMLDQASEEFLQELER